MLEKGSIVSLRERETQVYRVASLRMGANGAPILVYVENVATKKQVLAYPYEICEPINRIEVV